SFRGATGPLYTGCARARCGKGGLSSSQDGAGSVRSSQHTIQKQLPPVERMPRLDYIERDGLPAEWVVLRRRIHYKPLISMNIPNKPSLSDPKLAAAFTLIELLTVIAIIGILAAILIPVVGKVRSSAKAAMCMSNLRQIGTATFMYLNDHDDRFFPRVGGSRLTSMG